MTEPVHRSPDLVAPTATAVNIVDSAPRRRVSWGAIIAGAFIALTLQVLLNLLGLGFGLVSLEPGGEAPDATLAVGAILWWTVSGLAALFVGGAVAGRLAGSPTHVDGALHGLTVWSLATVLSIWLLTSSVGALLNSTLGLVGKGLGAASSAAIAGAPELADELDRRIDLDRSTWQEVENELREILRQTDAEALQPENIESRLRSARQSAVEDARAAARRPGDMDYELRSAVRRVTRIGEDAVDAADEDAAVSLLAARTDLTEEEARRTVDRWQAEFESVSERVGAWADEAQAAALEAVDEAGDAAAGSAFAAFFVMLVGAAAAGVGGAAGVPEPKTVTPREA